MIRKKEIKNNGPGVPVYLVSACLAGLRTRYDGLVKFNPLCMEAVRGFHWVPICPEQLGGLPTPRTPADLAGGDGADVLSGRARVIARNGEDVTEAFILGAEQVLAIAEMLKPAGIFLKARSPSCGLTPVAGVTAALLRSKGYAVQEF